MYWNDADNVPVGTTTVTIGSSKIIAEPITFYPGNPAGLVKGDTATYSIRLDPPGIYDDFITWSTINDLVTITSSGTGPEVTVQAGNTEGSSGLTASIMGFQLPTLFHIEITDLVDIEIVVHMVGTNGVYAITTNDVYKMVEGANEYLRPAGIRITVYDEIQYFINEPEWFDIDMRTGYYSQGLFQMNTVPYPQNNTTSKLKVFFINTIDGGETAGLESSFCIAISSDVENYTLAHEVLHACGLHDIYIYKGNNFINDTEFVKKDYVYHPKDWGAGYYDETVRHIDFIQRLLMYGDGNPKKGHIPHGDVYGVTYNSRQNPLVYVNGPAKTGLSNINRNPKHQTLF